MTPESSSELGTAYRLRCKAALPPPEKGVHGMTPPHVRPVATQVRQQCFGREIPFLQGVSEHCDSSGSQRALREGPFLIGRLGEVSDETAVPCQQGRQQRRQRLERVAEETPQERTLRAGLPAT